MHDDTRPIAEGQHLGLRCRDGWEFATRRRGQGVVAILALTTDRRLVLVEQHRVPLDASVIELPAGLVGDESSEEGESILDAARRELREETGFASDHWSDRTIEVASSAGLTDETVTILGAAQAIRVVDGGGVDGERITVHTVPIEELGAWLDERAGQGTIADGRVWAAAALAEHLGLLSD
jgi:ADP-ribose pyrophosphatase